jgi:iron complex transport system substrate-binding protein
VIHSRIPHDAAPSEIDRLVREFVSHGESVYAVDGDTLEQLAPDLIVTQDLCHVCAASPDDLAASLARFKQPPEVLCLNPQNLSDVWRDILSVGEKTGRTGAAQALVRKIHTRLEEIDVAVKSESIANRKRRVAFLEWLDPFYVGGHWVPEMIALAGGEDVFGKPGTPSFRVTERQIIEAAPEIMLISPCGYGAQRAREEYLAMPHSEAWSEIPAVRSGRVYALEANSYFSRPGPRLITGIEILATLLHAGFAVSSEAKATILAIQGKESAAQTATG